MQSEGNVCGGSDWKTNLLGHKNPAGCLYRGMKPLETTNDDKHPSGGLLDLNSKAKVHFVLARPFKTTSISLFFSIDDEFGIYSMCSKTCCLHVSFIVLTTCSCLFICTVSSGIFLAATLFNRMCQHIYIYTYIYIICCQLLQKCLFSLHKSPLPLPGIKHQPWIWFTVA